MGSCGRFRSTLLGLGVCGLVMAGCQAPIQRVPLRLAPADARVFVDGVQIRDGADAVDLRSDRPHVVLAKRDGYRAQQLVLEPREVDGVTLLDPAEIQVELKPLVPTARAFEIEAGND